MKITENLSLPGSLPIPWQQLVQPLRGVPSNTPQHVGKPRLGINAIQLCRWYSFIAVGAQKWVYKNDTVSFEWDWDQTKRYRNVVDGSLAVKDKNGNPIVRQVGGWKVWRTAEPRLPASRREQRD